jgi:predicted polyphosphate/ATP-dependent NAD kinase
VVTVGIIPNPASGKDIRRLIAHGSVFDNQEKVHIVRRVMLGLEAAGVDSLFIMPDYFGIGQRAVDGLQLKMAVNILEMSIEANQDDSTRAAGMMREIGVGSVVTLGGDGTNRAVAKEIGNVPIMAISTGTNNVFPQMVEGTLAGMAAGIVAGKQLPLDETAQRQLRLEVMRDGEMIDLALVDVVVSDDIFIGSRAIWDMSKVRELVLTRASPSNIGLSSVGGSLFCPRLDRQHGVYIQIGDGESLVEVTAPIAPGLVETLQITAFRLLEIGASVPVLVKPSILALDGEREVKVAANDDIRIALTDRGPYLIDTRRTMDAATRSGLLGISARSPGALPVAYGGFARTRHCRSIEDGLSRWKNKKTTKGLSLSLAWAWTNTARTPPGRPAKP